jgi:hypothetical protein
VTLLPRVRWRIRKVEALSFCVHSTLVQWALGMVNVLLTLKITSHFPLDVCRRMSCER